MTIDAFAHRVLLLAPPLWLALAVGFNTAAYLVLKSIAARPHDLVWSALFALGLGLGAVNVLCFTEALRHMKLAVAYPMFAGTSIAAIVAVSVLVFEEHLSTANLVGAALVVAGIIGLASR